MRQKWISFQSHHHNNSFHLSKTANLQAILSVPVMATLPLVEFLRVKPEMWEQVSRMLQQKECNCQTSNFTIKALNVRKLPV